MDLDALDDLARARAETWAGTGIRWHVVRGPTTDKPAAWLVLQRADAEGQLTLWVSGEVELEWGIVGARPTAAHREVGTIDQLALCVDELTTAVEARVP